jgi:hypothetical protein
LRAPGHAKLRVQSGLKAKTPDSLELLDCGETAVGNNYVFDRQRDFRRRHSMTIDA